MKRTLTITYTATKEIMLDVEDYQLSERALQGLVDKK